MPEIKNTFTQGKMNKDLDERIIPNGQYRDAMNVQVSTSEGSDVGTVQNILGNKRVEAVVSDNSKCVGSISNEKTNTLYWLVKHDDKDVILEFYQQDGNNICAPVFVDTKVNTSEAVLKFPDDIVTGINIIDDLLLWTDNYNEPRKININRSIQGTTDINTHTKLVVNNIVTANDVEEKHITVVKTRPLEVPTIITEVVNEDTEDVRLFEKDFVRFSLRYKYADGEYSAFGPFTEVIFKPGEFDIPVNETFNSGMLNSIKSIELKNFVPSNIPKDVIQVDILYKQEDSSTVYSIDSITSSDSEWNNNGSYTVSSENIRAALPSNQFLRVWDNVPRKALAQEVTGNRIVYANYTQNYDLDTSAQQRPEITVDYKLRDDITLERGINGVSGLPSIKSQRNYQLGVVYGDRYGRETPVFTSSNGSIEVPWSSSEGLNSNKANQLTTELNSEVPSWAEYYKVFVKETSGDYFNLSMDRIYQNPIQADKAEEEQTIWMSFPSSDRNKIKEEDYIILKNKRVAGGDPLAVSEKNKFKVLDIKNEAPEAITYELQSVGTVANDVTSSNTGIISSIFTDPNMIFNGHAGFQKQVLLINIAEWTSNGGAKIESDADRKEPIYFSFKNLTNGQRSKLYEISSAYEDDSTNYIIRLRNPISIADNWATDSSGDVDTTFDLQVSIEKRVKKDLNEFTGRFFVKIASTEFTRTEIEPEIIDTTDASLVTSATATIRWHADAANSANDFNHTTGILNYNGLLSQSDITTSGDKTTGISGTNSSRAVTDAPADWNSMANGTWFIDSLFFKSAQRKNSFSASASGRAFYGGGTIGNADESGGSLINNYGVGYSSIGVADGSMMVNGLEGFLTTSQIHQTKDTDGNVNFGARNVLRFPTYKKNLTLDYIAGQSENFLTTLSNDATHRNRTITYGQGTQSRHYIHLSFLAPGENLHNGSLPSDLNNFGLNTNESSLKNNLQNIICTGNWGAGSSTVQVFNAWEAPGQLAGGPTNFDVEPNDWDKVYNAWNPGYNNPENEKILERLKKGQKFKFTSDTSSDPTIFTIKYVRTLRLYNHTSWHNTHAWDGSANGGYQMFQSSDTGSDLSGYNSVEYHAKNWKANDTLTNRNKLAKALKNFGLANNRRVCYIIELDKNPADASSGQFSLSADDINSVDTQVIEFVEDDVDSTGILSRSKISVWETEPKKSVDLNIYYEATNAIPLTLTNENNITFAKPGDKFDLYLETVDDDGNVIEEVAAADHSISGLDSPTIAGWSGSNELTFNNFLIKNSSGNWIGETIGIPDPSGNPGVYYYDNYGEYELYIKIYKEGSGFYTARVIGHEVGDVKNFSIAGVNFNRRVISKFILEEENYKLPIGLNWFNCVSFNNGVESNKIQDDFNGNRLTSGARANATLEEPYKEEKRKSGLIYSGLYNSTSGVNDLNQFIMAEKITKDLNPTYGSIQKLFSRRVSLIAFCEDRVVGITANKNALYNADGNPQLVASDAVLGDANPFVGDYGISKNPESFASESYRAYFTDKQRGAVLRLSMDGITPISSAGMHDYFRDNLPTATRLIGSYDSYKQDYNLTLSNYLPLNLITNSKITEGVESADVLFLREILVNRDFSGSSWDAVETGLPFIITQNDNSDLNTETIITDHDEILADPATTTPGADYIPVTSESVVNRKRTVFSAATSDKFHIGNYHDADAFNSNGVGGVSMAKEQSTTSYVKPWGSATGLNANTVSNYQYVWSHNASQNGSMFTSNSKGWFYSTATDLRNFCYDIENNSHVEINVNDELTAHNGGVIRWKARVRMPGNLYNSTSGFGVPNDVKTAASPHLSFSLQLVHGDNNIPIPSEYLITTGSGSGHDFSNYANSNAVMHIDAVDITSSTHVDINGWWKFRNTKGSTAPHQKIANGSTSNWQELDLPYIGSSIVALNGGFNSFGDGNCGVDTNGDLVLYDDDGTSITRSASLNADGYYDAVSMQSRFPINSSNTEAQSRVFGKIKLRVQAWYTDGSGTSIGPNTANPDGTANFIENHPIFVGNLGEDNTVAYGIMHVSGIKYSWVEPCGFQGIYPNFTTSTVYDHGNGQDSYSIGYNGQTAVTEILAGSTQQYVPAWSQVEHSIVGDAWTPGTKDATFNPFTEAEAQHGPATTVDPATLSPQAATPGATPLVESDLSNTTTLYGDGSAALSPYTQDDRFTISLGGSGQKDIQSVLTGNPVLGVLYGLDTLVVDDWYELRVHYNVVGGGSMTGSVILRDVLEVGLAYNAPLPNHVGLYSGLGSPINSGGLALHDDGAGLLKGVFQVHSSSQMATSTGGGALNKIRILFNNISPDIEIEKIQLYDISTTGTGGTLSTGVGHSWTTNNQTPLVNYYSTPSLYSLGNNVVWNNSVSTGEYLLQTFQEVGAVTPQANDDGYELKFTISGYSSGELKGYINNDLGDAGVGTCEGFYFDSIDGDGEYIITGNFDGSGGTMTRDGVAVPGAVIASSAVTVPATFTTNSSYDGKLVFSPAVSSGTTLSLSNVSLIDLSNTFVSGSIDAWNFSGFDSTYDSFIDFDSVNENIVFNNSPLDSSGVILGTSAGSTDRIQIEQAITTKVFKDEFYKIKFDHDLTDGSISGYYFNKNGEGFRIASTTGDGTYNTTHAIGDANDKAPDELSETFVIYVNSVSGNGLNGTLDNFFMQKEYIDFEPTTVSYSEDVKGWTSFKSFIPESGLNLSKKYYTVKDGKLWMHHDEQTRNWFYNEIDGDGAPIIAKSTITAVLNQDPSLVKIFNTFNYEGSQSKVDQYKIDSDTNISNMDYHNLKPDKPGWYVESIETDKQKGSVNEFIEKEGKWFNYIKGNVNDIKTSDLSFQGLGIISDIQPVAQSSSSNGNGGSGGGNGY